MVDLTRDNQIVWIGFGNVVDFWNGEELFGGDVLQFGEAIGLAFCLEDRGYYVFSILNGMAE